MRYIIGILYILVFLGALNFFDRIRLREFSVGLFAFAILCLLSVLNVEYGLIEEKVASFVSYNIHRGLSDALTFKVQYFLAYIPF